jgi:phosphatidylglycerol:prolipoprotein diacylglycerol transferase
MLPILFSNNHFTLYTYPLVIGIAWGLAYRIVEYTLLRFSTYSIKKLGIFLAGCFISAWIGAKLLFLVVNNQHMTLIDNSSFWLGGGFVFYGGAIGVLIFISIYSLILKFFPAKDIPFLAPAAAISHAVGRVGCFLAGCCFGKECELLKQHEFIFLHRIPVQLIEAILLLILAKIIWIMLLRKQEKNVVVTYLGSYSIIRFILEFFRADSNRGIYHSLSTSQWISIFIITSILIYELFRFISYRHRLK